MLAGVLLLVMGLPCLALGIAAGQGALDPAKAQKDSKMRRRQNKSNKVARVDKKPLNGGSFLVGGAILCALGIAAIIRASL